MSYLFEHWADFKEIILKLSKWKASNLLIWQHCSDGDLLQAYTRTLQLTCNESQRQVIGSESHLKRRPGRMNRCCNDPRGCDTELTTEQQSCQLPYSGKRRSRGWMGLLWCRTSKCAVDHLDRGQLRVATAEQGIVDWHAPSPHIFHNCTTIPFKFRNLNSSQWITVACCNSSRGEIQLSNGALVGQDQRPKQSAMYISFKISGKLFCFWCLQSCCLLVWS